MVKRTQGLPLNTIVLAIIAIVVLVFLVLVFSGGIGKFIGQTNQVTSSNQTTSALCAEYASQIQTQMGTSTDPNAQLQMLANSQYVTSNCSIFSPYTFTLYNGSEVICGLGPKACINLGQSQGSQQQQQQQQQQQGGSGSSCAPPNGIPGCELK